MKLAYFSPLLPHRSGISDYSEELLPYRSEEHTSELQSRLHLVCRLLLEKKKINSETRALRLRLSPTSGSDSSTSTVITIVTVPYIGLDPTLTHRVTPIHAHVQRFHWQV